MSEVEAYIISYFTEEKRFARVMNFFPKNVTQLVTLLVTSYLPHYLPRIFIGIAYPIIFVFELDMSNLAMQQSLI